MFIRRGFFVLSCVAQTSPRQKLDDCLQQQQQQPISARPVGGFASLPRMTSFKRLSCSRGRAALAFSAVLLSAVLLSAVAVWRWHVPTDSLRRKTSNGMAGLLTVVVSSE